MEEYVHPIGIVVGGVEMLRGRSGIRNMCVKNDELHRKIVKNMVKWNKDKKSRVRMIFNTELSRSHYT